MRNKIINFFFEHRIIDSHFGVWLFHLWLYLLATYHVDMYLIGINIRIHKWQILSFYIELNLNGKPRNLSFEFKIFGIGIDTDRKYNQQVHKNVEEYFDKKNKALDEFKEALDDEQKRLIREYDCVR